jgi:predicted lipoprotein with Yx(FWY)xxD motif
LESAGAAFAYTYQAIRMKGETRMRGRVIRVLLPLAVAGAVAAGVSMAASAAMQSSGVTVKAAKSASFGIVLVNSAGHTLYRYTLDRKGVNACTGACTKIWPPLLLKASLKPTVGSGASSGLIGTIAAAKGMHMVTYAGFPLHLFSGDSKAGQTKGEGFDGKWFAVNTKGALVKHAVTTNTGGGYGGTTTTSAWG